MPKEKRPAPRESSVWRHPDAPAAPPRERSAPPRERSAPPREHSAPRRDDARPPRPTDGESVYRARPPAPSARPPRAPAETAPVASEAPGYDRGLQRQRELRIHGRAACLAVAADRFEGIRKVWFNRARSAELGPFLSRLAAARIGYREVDDAELQSLTESSHHEGICFDMLKPAPLRIDDLLSQLGRSREPCVLLLLEGVGNPHNLGAILRSAVHFGVSAVLLQEGSAAGLSGAAYRVAEGAAERVPIIGFQHYAELDRLKSLGFKPLATVVQAPLQLYDAELPARALLLFGAEASGLSSAARAWAGNELSIPGSGRVDSLNVGQAVVTVLGEHWRQWQD